MTEINLGRQCYLLAIDHKNKQEWTDYIINIIKSRNFGYQEAIDTNFDILFKQLFPKFPNYSYNDDDSYSDYNFDYRTFEELRKQYEGIIDFDTIEKFCNDTIDNVYSIQFLHWIYSENIACECNRDKALLLEQMLIDKGQTDKLPEFVWELYRNLLDLLDNNKKLNTNNFIEQYDSIKKEYNTAIKYMTMYLSTDVLDGDNTDMDECITHLKQKFFKYTARIKLAKLLKMTENIKSLEKTLVSIKRSPDLCDRVKLYDNENDLLMSCIQDKEKQYQNRIKNLELQIADIKYRPGGYGAKQAQEEFDYYKTIQ